MTARSRKKSKSGKKRSFLGIILLGVNLFAIILLLISYLAPHVSPEWSSIPAFLGLAYPYLALVNLLFILLWLLMFKIYFIWSLIAILLGFSMIARHFQLNKLTDPADAAIRAKVMTYNVRMFDFFDWKQNEESAEVILQGIGDASPDILCLQEFYNRPGRQDNMLRKIQHSGSLNSYHVAYDASRGDHAYGIATFSRYPIVDKGEVDISEKPGSHAIYTDLDLGGDTLRVYNLHLASYHFGTDDYAFFERLQKNQDTRNWKESSLKLMGKLRKGFLIRARQAEVIRQHILTSPFPVLICGDFNDTPGSFSYDLLSEGYIDAFRESGRGFGKTYAGILPSYRIDYILHSSDYSTINYETLRAGISDHYPVICYLTEAKP